MAFSIAVNCGIGDLAYLSVLVGTGIYLGFLLLVPIELMGFGTYHFENLGCLLLSQDSPDFFRIFFGLS